MTVLKRKYCKTLMQNIRESSATQLGDHTIHFAVLHDSGSTQAWCWFGRRAIVVPKLVKVEPNCQAQDSSLNRSLTDTISNWVKIIQSKWARHDLYVNRHSTWICGEIVEIVPARPLHDWTRPNWSSIWDQFLYNCLALSKCIIKLYLYCTFWTNPLTFQSSSSLL